MRINCRTSLLIPTDLPSQIQKRKKEFAEPLNAYPALTNEAKRSVDI